MDFAFALCLAISVLNHGGLAGHGLYRPLAIDCGLTRLQLATGRGVATGNRSVTTILFSVCYNLKAEHHD